MRRARVFGVGAAVAGVLTLSGCQRPLPIITVQDGAYAGTVSPSSYCFDPAHCHTGTLDLPVVKAAVDDKILIDVPRDLVTRGWAVQALTLDGKKVLDGSGAIDGVHSYRITSSAADGRDFLVQVRQLHDGRVDDSLWSFVVKVDSTG